MKIGFDATALPHHPVGAGVYIIELIRALTSLETEHQWVIFTHPKGQQLIQENSSQRIPDSSNIQWIITQDMHPAQRLMWEQTSLPVLVQRARLDILHSPHYTRPLFLPCASVVTFHDMTFFLYPNVHTRVKRIFFPAAIRMSARRADALLAVSENTRQDSIRLLKIPPSKIHTTPNGISARFRPIQDQHLLQACKEKYGLPDHFILYVGTIEPRKNLLPLLQAYQQLLQDGSHLKLVLVGQPGWMYQDVMEYVDQHELKNQVIFTGYVASEDLPMVYNSAIVFVYPSVYEGFGLPTLEAMACGTPVITTASSAMADYVGQAGYLMKTPDQQTLVETLNQVFNNQELRQQRIRQGLAQSSRFTWKKTAQKTLQVYHLVEHHQYDH